MWELTFSQMEILTRQAELSSLADKLDLAEAYIASHHKRTYQDLYHKYEVLKQGGLLTKRESPTSSGFSTETMENIREMNLDEAQFVKKIEE